MTADRRQRRAQLVRDRHEEVARQRLRLRDLRRHLAEARRQALDLAAAHVLGHRDVVVARGHFVRSRGQRFERPDDPP